MSRTHWKGEIHDFRLLLKDILENKAPLDLLEIRPLKLKEFVNERKSEFPCRGIRAWMESIPK